MSELAEKVRKSIERLRLFEPEEGYYLAFSGGKDSVCCKALLDLSGCRYDSTYRVTTVDPPELVRFIKTEHPDVTREIPRYDADYKNKNLAGKPITMWNLIPEKTMPPTRIIRFCCEYLKESGGNGRVTVTGVRWAESTNRKNNQGAVVIHGDFREDKIEGQQGFFDDEEEDFVINKRHGSLILTNDNESNRRIVESCYRKRKTLVNPIIEWTDEDVWEFIHGNGIRYCSLYDEGRSRLGCIGCPMASQRERETSGAGQSTKIPICEPSTKCSNYGSSGMRKTRPGRSGEPAARKTIPQLRTYSTGGWNTKIERRKTD